MNPNNYPLIKPGPGTVPLPLPIKPLTGRFTVPLPKPILGCGFTQWLTFDEGANACLQIKLPTDQLMARFIQDVSAPNSLLLVHFGDAVKNVYHQQEEAYNAYNVLPENFPQLTYEEKATLMRAQPPEIDYKRWSRQQWPYNSLRYAALTGHKLVFVQTDNWYCRYPSMFAEAMCGTLYTTSERPDPYTYRFAGHNTVLYCVGEFDLAHEMINRSMLSADIYLGDDSKVRNDFEWARMTDRFLLDVYEKLPYRDDITDIHSSYLYYPWENIYDYRHLPIRPVTLSLRKLGQPDIVVTATYLSDLPQESHLVFMLPIKEQGQRRKLPTMNKPIPLVWIFGPNVTGIPMIVNLVVIQDLLIPQNIIFDGTYDWPIITIEGKGTLTYADIAEIL